MDNENIESEITLVDRLIDVLGYCDVDSYETISQLADTKLKALAQSGHPKLPYLHAYMPQIGMEGGELDKRFNELIKQSSDSGVPQAQYTHACHLYECGDFHSAVNLYKLSADNGFPPSQYCYGLDLYNGVGIHKNESEGLYFIELAAGRLYNLALEFLIGIFQNDSSVDGKKKFEHYSKMLSWSERYE